jgi:hypothetical protein
METVRRRDLRTVADLAKSFMPHLFPGQFRIQGESSTNREISLDKFIFRCEKRQFKIEFATLVVLFSCGGLVIPIVTESKQLAEFRELLFPNLKSSIKIDFYQNSEKIEDTKYVRALDLKLPITITATRLFIVHFQNRRERVPFSQWSKVIDLKRTFAFRHCCLISCLTVSSIGQNPEIFQNGTSLWDVSDELIFFLRNDPSVIIIIDGEIEEIAAFQTVSETIKSLQLNWIQGNGSELCGHLHLKNVPEEMILTASRQGQKSCLQAGDFQFELSSKVTDSWAFKSIVERLLLGTFSNEMDLSQDGRSYKVKDIRIQVKVIGLFQEVRIHAWSFWSVDRLQGIVQGEFRVTNCVLTFLCRRLNRDKPLNFYGIQDGSELRVIEDPNFLINPKSLFANITWTTLPGERNSVCVCQARFWIDRLVFQASNNAPRSWK